MFHKSPCNGSVQIEKRKIANLRYTNETTLLVHYVKSKSEYFGLYINLIKTKIIIIDKAKGLPASAELQNFEKGYSFLYFGALSTDGRK